MNDDREHQRAIMQRDLMFPVAIFASVTGDAQDGGFLFIIPHPHMYTDSLFSRLAKLTSQKAGHPSTFLCSVGIILTWAMLGPAYNYSDTWQLVINTGTTIITFLMVFLIQNTQNRDSEAMQLKLNELIRVTKGAHNSLLRLEELSEQELEIVHARYHTLAMAALAELRRGGMDTDDPSVDVN